MNKKILQIQKQIIDLRLKLGTLSNGKMDQSLYDIENLSFELMDLYQSFQVSKPVLTDEIIKDIYHQMLTDKSIGTHPVEFQVNFGKAIRDYQAPKEETPKSTEDLIKGLIEGKKVKFNGGICGETCNCISVEESVQGGHIKDYPCLGDSIKLTGNTSLIMEEALSKLKEEEKQTGIVQVGEYSISESATSSDNKKLFIVKSDGEASEFNKVDFEPVLRDFYEENF